MKALIFLNKNILWGIPMLILMLSTGVYLTILTKGIIFKKFGYILKSTAGSLFLKKEKSSNKVSPFAAVSTALAATVGTGNITGVAVAIRLGGPGAVFWMWVSALLGMVIKYSEVTLALHYRKKLSDGEYSGGPMYYMKNGLRSDFLSGVFCIFAALSSFGIGNTVQASSLSASVKSLFGINEWITGIILSLLCGAVLIGGIKRISATAEILVPVMALFYMIFSAMVLFIYKSRIPDAFLSIFKSAFTSSAPIGGFSGAGIMYAIRIGVSRGLFTNEAGLGSAPIAHACADTDHPVRQGMWGAFEVFFDTIVMCSVTALVILVSGVWTLPQSTDEALLTHIAFSHAIPFGGQIVSAGLILFAFASIIAWYFYGEKCVDFIFGKKGISVYRVLYVSACFLGCVFDMGAIWEISDFLNAFMAVPNLIALILLAPVVKKITENFFSNSR